MQDHPLLRPAIERGNAVARACDRYGPASSASPKDKQVDADCRPLLWLAGHLKMSVMLLHKTPDDREPKPASQLFRGKKSSKMRLRVT